MEAYKKEFIEFMVESEVLKFGDFTLKSGRKSPFFMNAGAYVKIMSDVASTVKEIIVEKLGVKESEVTPEANFTNDLGADSLDTVEMIMEFETKFDIKIADDQAEKITTVGEAIAHIEKAIAEK